ncbi:MAG: hypothetical protein RLZ45_2733 [Verrucomicrobiota bacterium]
MPRTGGYRSALQHWVRQHPLPKAPPTPTLKEPAATSGPPVRRALLTHHTQANSGAGFPRGSDGDLTEDVPWMGLLS